MLSGHVSPTVQACCYVILASRHGYEVLTASFATLADGLDQSVCEQRHVSIANEAGRAMLLPGNFRECTGPSACLQQPEGRLKVLFRSINFMSDKVGDIFSIFLTNLSKSKTQLIILLTNAANSSMCTKTGLE
jgi:hypothetical protein